MTTNTINDRTIFEDFQGDPRFEGVRKVRSQLQPTVAVLRSNVRRRSRRKNQPLAKVNDWLRLIEGGA